jgi:hypothetical protein
MLAPLQRNTLLARSLLRGNDKKVVFSRFRRKSSIDGKVVGAAAFPELER